MDRPAWVTNEHHWRENCREVVQCCRDLVEGRLGVIEAARVLRDLAFRVRAEEDSDFKLFRFLDSESDALPIGPKRPDCRDECPFYPSYASTGQWFVDDPARPEGQSVTWVGQTSYVQPYAAGAAFTIEWGYAMSNGALSYIPPALATPWASQQRQISAAYLWWTP
jgi:hypothetical protein